MTTVEVGCQGNQVVLLITTREGQRATVTRVPLSLDSAKELSNGIGESILCASRFEMRAS